MPGHLGDFVPLTGWEGAALYCLAGVAAILGVQFFSIVVPDEGFVIAIAATVRTPEEFLLLSGLVAAGTIAGEAIGYGVGYRWGRLVRQSRLGRRIGDRRWTRAERFFDSAGGWSILGARFVFAICALFPLIAGVVRMRFRRYLAICAVGAVTWSFTCVGLGATVGASYRAYGSLGLLGWGILLVTVIAVLVSLKYREQAPMVATQPGSGEPSVTP